MNTDDTAKELAKVFKESMKECVEIVIEQRCYLVILELLKNIEKKNEKIKNN